MPTAVYSEIDSLRREVRKVEVFSGGRYGFASVAASRGDTQLGLPEAGRMSWSFVGGTDLGNAHTGSRTVTSGFLGSSPARSL